jgi:predicted metalloendopeptidase
VLREIGKEVDKSEWYMYPQEVNAYYASQSNEIVFPAGILTVRHPPTHLVLPASRMCDL